MANNGRNNVMINLLLGAAVLGGILALVVLVGLGGLLAWFMLGPQSGGSELALNGEETGNVGVAGALPERPGGGVIEVPVTVVALPALERPVNVMLIFDASGSMNAAAEGTTRLVVAQDVLLQVINDMPESIRAGLMVYGHTVPGQADLKPEGCEDIETLVDIAPLDRDQILGELYDIQALGYTPITRSLELAAPQFTPGEDNSIILISDGEETCDRDPAEMATELQELGIGLDIYVIGFAIDDPNVRSQLESIAMNGGGIYTDAQNAQDLANAMATVLGEIERQAEIAAAATDTPTPVPATATPLPPTATPLPPTATPVPPTPTQDVTDISGNYRVNGTNLAGESYDGSATITSAGGNRFAISWTLNSGETFAGEGDLVDGVYTVDDGTFVNTYVLQGNGVLDGTWTQYGESGSGTEVLTPIN